MAQYVYSSREFRDHQAEALSRAEAGDRVIIRPRNRRGGVLLTWFNDEELTMSPAFIEKIERGMAQAARGEGHRFENVEDMRNWFESL